MRPECQQLRANNCVPTTALRGSRGERARWACRLRRYSQTPVSPARRTTEETPVADRWNLEALPPLTSPSIAIPHPAGPPPPSSNNCCALPRTRSPPKKPYALSAACQLSAADHSLPHSSAIEIPPTGSSTDRLALSPTSTSAIHHRRQRAIPGLTFFGGHDPFDRRLNTQITASPRLLISFPVRNQPSWTAGLDFLLQDQPGTGTDDSITPSNPDDHHTLQSQKQEGKERIGVPRSSF